MDALHLIGKITCKHNYANQSARGLELIPTHHTKSLCQREELWLHHTEGTVEVYTKKTNMDTIDASQLQFWVKVTDPQFYNYIYLPGVLPNQARLLCFENEKEEIRLTPRKELMKNVQRKMQVVVFDEEVLSDEQIRIFDGAGNMISEEVVAMGSKSTVLDLTREEDGLYTWTFNGFSGSFFLTDQNLNQMVGVCLFHINAEKVHSIDIQFETKKTYWEYLIVSKEDIRENDHDIIDNDGKYTFSCKGKVKMMGVEAIGYLSDQEIPYREHPKTLFKLVPNRNDNAPYLTLSDRTLPNASPENIKIHNTKEGRTFKTQTIVYI